MKRETPEKNRPEALGAYLASLRTGARMSLREVEEATAKEVSNAYLSQLEHGRIAKPSPHVLYSLAQVYKVSYELLMERAGYLVPSDKRPAGGKHGRAAAYSIENLTAEEETELLKYLAWYRARSGKGEKARRQQP